MADKEKSEAEAKPEEISDKDLTEVVGGVQGVASGSTSPGTTGPATPSSGSGSISQRNDAYWDSYENAKQGGFGE